MAGSFFDQSKVLAGLYTAMEFGAPNNVADRATFYMPRTVDSPGNVDSYEVSYNPDNKRTFSPLIKGFEYVVISGQKFIYQKTEPLIALGSIDVAIIYAQAEDLM
jgi:hypothetical protein